MKNKCFAPFIGQLVVASLLYLGIPLTVLALNVFEVRINPQYTYWGAPLTVAIIVAYMVFIAAYFAPGMCGLFDWLTNNFVTTKMVFVNGYLAKLMFVANKVEKGANKNNKRLIDSYYIRVILADHKGKSTYATTFFHQMECGKSYTITYGKYSKILTSVLSEQGDEMLMFDIE